MHAKINLIRNNDPDNIRMCETSRIAPHVSKHRLVIIFSTPRTLDRSFTSIERTVLAGLNASRSMNASAGCSVRNTDVPKCDLFLSDCVPVELEPAVHHLKSARTVAVRTEWSLPTWLIRGGGGNKYKNVRVLHPYSDGFFFFARTSRFHIIFRKFRIFINPILHPPLIYK